MSEPRVANTILLIDDEEDILAYLQERLTRAGHGGVRFVQAGSVGEALGILKETVVDLVICDFNIGRESGLAIYFHVRKEAPDKQFVFFTGSADILLATLPASDFFLGAIGKAEIERLERLVERWLEERQGGLSR